VPKKFEFRLQGVLNYRKQIEETRVRELAQAKGALLEIEEVRKANAAEEAETLERFGEIRGGSSVNVDQAVVQSLYWDRLLAQEKKCKELEKKIAEEVGKRRQKALNASREKKLLENLKERKLRAHQADVASEEQRFLDEHSAIAYVRRERLEDQAVGEREFLGR